MDNHKEQEKIRTFWEQRGKESDPNRYGSTLLTEHQQYVDYIHERESAYLQQWIDPLTNPHILDHGCGTGRLSFTFAEQAGKITGFDIAKSMVDLANQTAKEKKLSHISFAQRGIEESVEDLSPVDIAIFSGVFTYASDEQVVETLSNTSKVLKSGGFIYMRNNCANIERYSMRRNEGGYSTLYRTREEYISLVEQVPDLAMIDEQYLFPPICLPNMLYYHVIPHSLRENHTITKALSGWFLLEKKTADLRMRLLGEIYPHILRTIKKPTSFAVLTAVKK